MNTIILTNASLARINIWLLAIQSLSFENGSYLIVVPSLNLCCPPTYRIGSVSNKCIALDSHVCFFKIWKMQMCLTYIVFWSLSYLIYVTTCYFVGEMKDSNVSYLYFIHVSCVFSVMRKYILFLNFHLHTLLAPPLISSLN